MASTRALATDDTDRPGDPKRRKIRKGTHSCWDCKRRKERCAPTGDQSGSCVGCLNRGTECISQEVPEEVFDQRRSAASNDSRSITSSTVPRLQQNPQITTDQIHTSRPAHTLRGPPSLASISEALHAALPSSDECAIIYKASSRHSVMFNGSTLTMPYTALDPNSSASSGAPPVPPSVHAHPVLIAKHLLGLICLLQDLHPNVHDELQGLSEPPRAMIEHLAETAISLVTSQSRLLASLEGLECVVLESVYHGNCGNLRLSWMACRRAMLLAQLLGLHAPEAHQQYQVLDPASRSDPQFLWFRIVHYDRYMCLLLGLPQGSTDVSMAGEALLASDTAMGGLERIQCVLALRILQRNESDPSSIDFNVTQDLDKDLQQAAKALPSKWWLVPDLANLAQTREEVFWDIQRLYVQIFHFNLLNQLHIPYMLLASTDRRYCYSKFACVNASREILSRFAVLRRSSQVAYNCRTVDYLAVMAAVTLLLAHLDSYRHPSQGDIMTHLYLGDRAMMEQAQENMQEVGRSNEDPLSRQSTELLRRLLAIEAEAADGHAFRAQSLIVQTRTPSALPRNSEENAAQMHVPYFGLIKFALDGIAAQATRYPFRPIGNYDARLSPLTTISGASLRLSNLYADSNSSSLRDSETAPSTLLSGDYDSDVSPPPQSLNQQSGLATSVMQPSANVWNPKFMEGGFYDPLLPGLTGTEEWSLEGVDIAYFERLVNGFDKNSYLTEQVNQGSFRSPPM